MEASKNSEQNTVHSGYKEHIYKGQPVIRDTLAGTESFPFFFFFFKLDKEVRNMIIIVFPRVLYHLGF